MLNEIFFLAAEELSKRPRHSLIYGVPDDRQLVAVHRGIGRVLLSISSAWLVFSSVVLWSELPHQIRQEASVGILGVATECMSLLII
jgi:hypothetical protein